MQISINKNIVKKWLDIDLSMKDISSDLTKIGFESEIDKNDVLTISVPSNRDDCLYSIGIIKEIASLYNLNIKNIHLNCKNIRNIEVYIEDFDFCYEYNYIIIENINIKYNTPNYIKNILKRDGFKLNYTIIDILNFVMLELGQPLHAYDMDYIDDISIKKNNNKNKIQLLNGDYLNIKKNIYVIESKNNIISIPGIIGTNKTKITEKTTNILIESANFNNKIIKKIIKKTNIITKAAEIFEKNLGFKTEKLALKRAAELILELLGGNSGKIISIVNKVNDVEKKIKLYKSKLTKILGIKINHLEVIKILNNLNLKVDNYPLYWNIHIPMYRKDLNIKEDIIEEIVRYYGYNKIPCIPPKLYMLSNNNLDIKFINTDKIRSILINKGSFEAINYSFVSSKIEKNLFGHNEFINIINPISENLNVMRTSLLQGLLKTVSYNINRRNEYLSFFETGNIFKYEKENIKEIYSLGFICELKKKKNWLQYNEEVNFFTVKNIVEEILGEELCIKNKKNVIFSPKNSTVIMLNNKVIGSLGILNEKVTSFFDLKEEYIYFEIDLSIIKKKQVFYKPYSIFPSIKRDISMLIDNHLKYNAIIDCIKALNIKFLISINLLDLYHINNVKNKKSLTIRVEFNDTNRTLEKNEIDNEINIIHKNLLEKLNIKIR